MTPPSALFNGTPLQLASSSSPFSSCLINGKQPPTLPFTTMRPSAIFRALHRSGILPALSHGNPFPRCAFGSGNGPLQLDDDISQELASMTGALSLLDDLPRAPNSMCVGIDPDLSGAIAVLKMQSNTVAAEVIDVPCVTVEVNKRKRRRHDYQSIAALVKQLQAPAGSLAYVEQAMPFPKDGKQGWYITGYGYGVWLGILAAAGFTVLPVQARVWKTAMGICGKEFSKDDSRALASSMFPVLSPQLRRKKDHGRAEALLIAAFGKGMTLSSLPSLDEASSLTSSSTLVEQESLLQVSSSFQPPV